MEEPLSLPHSRRPQESDFSWRTVVYWCVETTAVPPPSTPQGFRLAYTAEEQFVFIVNRRVKVNKGDDLAAKVSNRIMHTYVYNRGFLLFTFLYFGLFPIKLMCIGFE